MGENHKSAKGDSARRRVVGSGRERERARARIKDKMAAAQWLQVEYNSDGLTYDMHYRRNGENQIIAKVVRYNEVTPLRLAKLPSHDEPMIVVPEILQFLADNVQPQIQATVYGFTFSWPSDIRGAFLDFRIQDMNIIGDIWIEYHRRW